MFLRRAVRVEISLTQKLSESVSPRVAKQFDKSTLIEISLVFGTLPHVDSRRII